MQRSLHALLDRHGMQAVQQQQVGDELILAERLRQRAVVARGEHVDDPPETLAVEVEQRLHDLRCGRTRGGIGERLQLLQQPLNPCDLLTRELVGPCELAGACVIHRRRRGPLVMRVDRHMTRDSSTRAARRTSGSAPA